MARPSKERQDATLDKMQKRRAKDGMVLREKVETKLKWAIEERDKAIKIIQNYEKQISDARKNIDDLTRKVFQLNGCILALKDLQTENKESKDDNIKD